MMRQKRKSMLLGALLLAFALIMVACGSAASSTGDASGNASADASGSASGNAGATITYEWDDSQTEAVKHVPETSGDVTLANVTYGADYVETTASGDDTINSPSASSNIISVDLMQDGKTAETIESTAGGVLTAVVTTDEGVEYRDILDLVESGETIDAASIVFYETEVTEEYTEMAKFMNMAGQTAHYTYRTALKITDGAISATESMLDLFDSDVEASGDSHAVTGNLALNGAFINGIVVDGDSDVTISDMTITANGDGANDFQGEAAAVLAADTSTVTL